MRAGLIVTGVLGLGTAVVFACAALTATLFPNGTLVAANPWGNPVMRNWDGGVVAVPVPAPAIDVAPDVMIEAPPDGFKSLPGDIVVSEPAP